MEIPNKFADIFVFGIAHIFQLGLICPGNDSAPVYRMHAGRAIVDIVVQIFECLELGDSHGDLTFG
jgi:hypothetical protein